MVAIMMKMDGAVYRQPNLILPNLAIVRRPDKKLVKEQMNECRDAIAALQAERDDISAKIYDPDQVREILEELTNQLDSLADKMKSADSWQKDQLVRKLVTNLEINNKNEVSFRWKKPLEHVFNEALKNRTRFGARDWT